MAIIFAIFSMALISIYLKARQATLMFFALGLILSILMFWHHVTDILTINL